MSCCSLLLNRMYRQVVRPGHTAADDQAGYVPAVAYAQGSRGRRSQRNRIRVGQPRRAHQQRRGIAPARTVTYRDRPRTKRVGRHRRTQHRPRLYRQSGGEGVRAAQVQLRGGAVLHHSRHVRADDRTHQRRAAARTRVGHRARIVQAARRYRDPVGRRAVVVQHHVARPGHPA